MLVSTELSGCHRGALGLKSAPSKSQLGSCSLSSDFSFFVCKMGIISAHRWMCWEEGRREQT